MGGYPATPVIVVWRDTIHRAGWSDAPAVGEINQKCISCGFLIRKDEKEVLIAMSYCYSSKSYGDFEIIPSGCIDALIKVRKDRDLWKH